MILGYQLVRRLSTHPHGERWLAARDGERAVVEVLQELSPRTVGEVIAAAAALKGKRILPRANVIDAGLVEGRGAIVTEAFLGIDLLELPRLPLPLAATVVAALGQLLGRLAERGLVHGAIGLGQLVVGLDGEVTLVGNTWVRPLLLERARLGVALEHELSLVAPEILRGEPATPAADVYTLGRLLQELCAQNAELRALASRACAEPASGRTISSVQLAEAVLQAVPEAASTAELAAFARSHGGSMAELEDAWRTAADDSGGTGDSVRGALPRGEALAVFSGDLPHLSGNVIRPPETWKVESTESIPAGLGFREAVSAWASEGTADIRRHERNSSRVLMIMSAACLAAFSLGFFVIGPRVNGSAGRREQGSVVVEQGRVVRLPDAPVPRPALTPRSRENP